MKKLYVAVNTEADSYEQVGIFAKQADARAALKSQQDDLRNRGQTFGWDYAALVEPCTEGFLRAMGRKTLPPTGVYTMYLSLEVAK